MKQKNDEVDEALEELGKFDEMQEENDRLNASLGKIKGKHGEIDIEELLDTERELQELTKEFQLQSKEIEKIRTDRDFLENKVDELESEKTKLKTENQLLEVELRESKTSDDSPSRMPDFDNADPKRLKELEDNVRLKNKQIHQLLEDIENLEKINEEYQEKFTKLRDELSDATGQINMVMSEYMKTKKDLEENKTLIDILQKDNTNLKLKNEDQLKDKAKRESEIENISLQVEKKVEEMKSICKMKDAKIDELMTRLNRSKVVAVGKEEIEEEKQARKVLSNALKDRDKQIETLEEQLQTASRDLESSATLIEELKGSKKEGVDPMQKTLLKVRSELYESQKKAAEIKEQLQEAEESAKYKSEELSDAIVKLRKYETGEYGLQQAIAELETSKRAERLRDKQCQDLTKSCDDLEFKNKSLRAENHELREKLGIKKTDDDGAEQKYDGSSRNVKEDKALVQIMHKEIERLEEERLQLKTSNRKLAQQLGQRAAKLGLNAEDLEAIQEYTDALKNRRLGGLDESDSIKVHKNSVLMQKQLQEKSNEVSSVKHDLMTLQGKYDDIFEENDKLRQGMHEILDSVKDQDGKSDVVVSCPVLENLLTILDARHFYGEYKPAMGLKSKMEKMDGWNSCLRDQNRSLRLEGDKMTTQNNKLRLKIQRLESELKSIKEENPFNQSTNNFNQSFNQFGVGKIPLIDDEPISSVVQSSPAQSVGKETVRKLETQLMQVLDELTAKDSICKKLETELEKFGKMSNTSKHKLGILYSEQHSNENTLIEENSKLKKSLQEHEVNLEAASTKVTELEKFIENEGDDEAKLVEMARKVALVKANESTLIRRFKISEENNHALASGCSKLKDELNKLQCHYVKTIGELQRYKDMYCFKIESLQKSIEDSVPVASLENANRQYNEITAKYRDLLQKQQSQSLHVKNMEDLQLQVQAYRDEKEVYQKELTVSKEKILSLESIVSSLGRNGPKEADSEIVKLSKQIATLEVKELNERQKNDYVNNKNQLLTGQLNNLETRYTELEEKFEMISNVNLELQKVERDLRDQILTSIPKDEYELLNSKYQDLLEKELKSQMEISKCKEISDISQIQLASLELKKGNSLHELEALKHQILDLQAQSDEKALIGRLHQQLLSLQLNEKEYNQQRKTMESHTNTLEANLLKANKKCDDLQNACHNIELKYNNKIKKLTKIIQDLRRQFSGAIPLVKQEKLSKQILDLNEQKHKLSKMLAETEVQLKDVEKRSEEMKVKQEGIDEVLKSLRNSTGAKQVLEWHSKLENLRIKELHTRRNADHWEKEVIMLRDLCKTESRKAEQFEDEIVRLETALEHKQLEYETKEIESESSFLNLGQSFVEEEAPSFSNASSENLSLSKQLDTSLKKNRTLLQEINEMKNSLQYLKTEKEDLVKKLRASEKQLLNKEKTITDLRDQLPDSVNRAVAITSVIGQSGGVASTDQKTDKILQSTIESLKQRLKQKESTMEKYEKMMEEAQKIHEEEIKRLQEKILETQNNLRSQQTAFNAVKTKKEEVNVSSASQISKYMSRIQELEDEIQEMQVSIGQMSSDLLETKRAKEELHHIANVRLQELEEIKEHSNLERNMGLQKQNVIVDQLKNEVKTYQKENNLLRDEIRRIENSSVAPTASLKNQIDKLKNEVALKDSKLMSMSNALLEIKNEMISDAGNKKSVRKYEPRSKSELGIDGDDNSQSLKSEVSRQNIMLDKLRKQIKGLKENENKMTSEISNLKEDMEKKSNAILKLKEEKIDYLKFRKGSRQSSSNSDKSQTKDLIQKIDTLEDKLKTYEAEKPYEDDEKLLKNTAEMARWEERKKWQKKMEDFRDKLKDADKEVSKLSKQNTSFRETISRLEREKFLIQQKWKSYLKCADPESKNYSHLQNEALKQEISELKNQLEEKNNVKEGEPGNETLKLRVKFLQDRIEQQERKISILELGKRGGSTAIMKEMDDLRIELDDLKKKKIKIEEENLDLKIKVQGIKTSPTKQSVSEKVMDKKVLESLNSLKQTNETLLVTLEKKERKINELQMIIQGSSKANLKEDEKDKQIRQMEIDLKRKSDLLSEVKVLLRQAADRERQMMEEKEALRLQCLSGNVQ